ncbi:MAG: hypothetical protein AAFR45_05675 [Pseudomonadota bacterium]
MTATTDFGFAANKVRPEFETSMPVKLGFGGTYMGLRVVFRVLGTALVMVASGMWLVPATELGPETMLIKFGASLFFLLCGLALLMRNHEHALPEVYFDPIRRELRVLQKNAKGRPETVLRRSYDSLGGAMMSTDAIELWDEDGSTLMRLPLSDDAARRALRKQLGSLCA